MSTVLDLLERTAGNYPDLIAVTSPQQSSQVTWSELRGRARHWGAGLAAQGVAPGDRVAIVLGNTLEFPIALFAVLYAGGVAVPVNSRLTPTEAAGILAHSEVKLAICNRETRPLADASVPVLEPQGLDQEQPAALPPGPAGTDDAEIIYTSGTTGQPKGVVMTHAAVVETAAMAAYEFGMRPRDRVAVLMPVTHSAPLNLFLVGATYTGSTVVLDTFNPRDCAAMLALLEREAAQYLFAAPVAYLLALGADPSRYNLSAMKCWVYGGAPMSTAQVQTVRGAFGGRWMGVYGLTESGPNGIALADEDHDLHAGSLGWHPTVNTEVRLVDGEGRDVPAGTPGELIMRTPSAMRAYFKNPEATSAVLRDGWIYTGDMARRDGDGYYWMLDRKKDLILSGGYNVYPREVEDAVLTHPAVLDVAVVATPHPEWGETVAAVVVLQPGRALSLEQLRDHLRPLLASQKHPRRLEVVTALPRNATGKLLREEVRRTLASAPPTAQPGS